jgi:hypothetical protein
MLTELLTAIKTQWSSVSETVPLWYQEVPQDATHNSTTGAEALPPIYAIYFPVPRTPMAKLLLGGARIDDTLIQFSVFASQSPDLAKQISPLAALAFADEVCAVFDNFQLALTGDSSCITMRRTGLWPDADPDGGYVVHIEYQASTYSP